ncbi:MAG: thermonuclease family protein [Pseudomonadota bacterium]|nr:thermonuclease family protein [Pseudomonadota bacterium]
MKPPRRIFRGSAARRIPLARTLLAAAVGMAGTAALAMTTMSSDPFGRATPLITHVAADAHNIAIIDGDTLRLEGHVVRLRGVEAPDRGDRCLGGIDCGGAATTALAGLIRGRRVECSLKDRDPFDRPYAECNASGTDLSRAIVASGWARAQPGVPELADLELHARRQRTGLWADVAAH